MNKYTYVYVYHTHKCIGQKIIFFGMWCHTGC